MERHAVTDNASNNVSDHGSISSYWQHTKQAIKGFILVGLGMVSYSILNSFIGTTKNSKNEESLGNKNTDLIEYAHNPLEQKSILGFSSDLTTIKSSSFEVQNTLSNTQSYKLDIDYPGSKVDKNKLQKISTKRTVNTYPIAVEIGINTVKIYNQQSPSITASSDGFIVGWQSEGQDGDGQGVFIKKFDHYGRNLTLDIQANTYTAAEQKSIALAGYGDNFLAAWQSTIEGSRYDINIQRFNAQLEKIGNELSINDYNGRLSSLPRADCSLVNDQCTVVWYSLLGTGFDYSIIGQRLSNFTKQEASFVLNNPSAEAQTYASVTYLSNGNNAFVWGSYLQDGSGWSIVGRTYDKPTATLSSEIILNPYTTGDQIGAIIANMPTANKIFIGWSSVNQDGSGAGCYGKVTNYNYSPLTSAVQLNSYIQGDQQPTSAVYLTKKIPALFVTWDSFNQDGYGNGIYGQLFSQDLVKIGREFQINSYSLGDQSSAKSVELNDGNLAVVWQSYGQDGSGYGIYSRILIPDISLFAYNLNIPKIYTEDQTFQFTDLVVNPMVDADKINASLTLSNPSAGTLSIESANNITSTFNPTLGIWQVIDASIVDINRILERLKFIPSSNFNNDFTIQVDLNDNNLNHTSYSDTLTMIGTPVNDAPVLTANRLALNQGDALTLGLDNINATDADNALSDLTFIVAKLVQGQFETKNNPGKGITSFTYYQLSNSEIIFIHDNKRFAPAYEISVSDGNSNAPSQPATIDFNARPELLNNQLNIEGGRTVILTQNNLKASDDNTAEGKLIFEVKEVTNGYFKILSALDSAVTKFAQQQVIDNQVQFIHDGSTQAPSFKTSVYDGHISSDYIPVTVNFIANSPSTLDGSSDNTLPLAVGVSVGAAALLAAIAISIWQGRKQLQSAQGRRLEPLANAVRTKMRLQNVDDFTSPQGESYVEFINLLKNALVNFEIETGQMSSEQIDQLAGNIKDAITETMQEKGIKLKKTPMGAIVELNIQTLKTDIDIVAAKTKAYFEKDLVVSHHDVPLNIINPVINV